MNLLLDLGNSRLKWALQLHHGEDWLAHGAVDWQEDVSATLRRACSSHGMPAVYAASVVDAAREQMVAEGIRACGGRDIRWLRTPAMACGIRNAYPEPERLGVDRFLAMVAAHADGLGACVLAGVGTALTLDALMADGTHLGGLIAPGPPLMQQALLGRTSRIRAERPGSLVPIADNTADAVHSGCWLAAAALVERFARQATVRLGAMPAVRLGGGDAESLARLIDLPAECVHDSVLRGLAVWARSDETATP